MMVCVANFGSIFVVVVVIVVVVSRIVGFFHQRVLRNWESVLPFQTIVCPLSVQDQIEKRKRLILDAGWWLTQS